MCSRDPVTQIQHMHELLWIYLRAQSIDKKLTVWKEHIEDAFEKNMHPKLKTTIQRPPVGHHPSIYQSVQLVRKHEPKIFCLMFFILMPTRTTVFHVCGKCGHGTDTVVELGSLALLACRANLRQKRRPVNQKCGRPIPSTFEFLGKTHRTILPTKYY